MRRGFKGIWIPAVVWECSELSWPEKVMLVEIDSLYDEKRGGCYASNGYFAQFFSLSKSRISEIISTMNRKGFIKVVISKITKGGCIKCDRLMWATKLVGSDSRRGVRQKRIRGSEYRIGGSESGECIKSTDNKVNKYSRAELTKILGKDIKSPELRAIFEKAKLKGAQNVGELKEAVTVDFTPPTSET